MNLFSTVGEGILVHKMVKYVVSLQLRKKYYQSSKISLFLQFFQKSTIY